MGRKQEIKCVPESALRLLWESKNIREFSLFTNDNKLIKIVKSGCTNTDSGPDFINAVLRIGSQLFRGDVEIHCRNKEWFEHKHHQDDRYNSVILHVVYLDDLCNSGPVTHSGRIIPVLSLWRWSNVLNPLIRRYSSHDFNDGAGSFDCPSDKSYDPSRFLKWIFKMGMKRVELRVRRFDERLHELIEEKRRSFKEPRRTYGSIPFGINPEELPPPELVYSRYEVSNKHFWEQLLYEGCMEALGYDKNQQPFLCMARRLSLNTIVRGFTEIPDVDKFAYLEALLFGTAHLLDVPQKWMDGESKKKLRCLRSLYNKIGEQDKPEILKKSDWQFFRLRPENFPTVRLAGAVQLSLNIIERNIFREIIRCIKESGLQPSEKFRTLVNFFIIPAGEFWNSHYRFGVCARRRIESLIGKNRAMEIVINVVIPLALLYARVFRDQCVREQTISLMQAEINLPVNSIIRRMNENVFINKSTLVSIQTYQGILHIYKSYCVRKRCNQCEIYLNQRPTPQTFHI